MQPGLQAPGKRFEATREFRRSGSRTCHFRRFLRERINISPKGKRTCPCDSLESRRDLSPNSAGPRAARLSAHPQELAPVFFFSLIPQNRVHFCLAVACVWVPAWTRGPRVCARVRVKAMLTGCKSTDRL